MMKPTKKLMALLLAALLIASTFSAAFALDPIEIAGYTFKDYGDCGNGVKWYFGQKIDGSDENTILIRGNGAMTNYSASNLPQWTKLKEKIRKVVVQKGVTNVGDFAFSGCKMLESVVLEEGVRTVGMSAFAGCGRLSTVSLFKDLQNIGESAFEKCYSLRTIDLPAGLRTIGRYAFFQCENLESEVVIPKGVVAVSDSAFFGCESIKSLVLEEGVTSIGNSTFSGCTALQKVSLPKSLLSMDKSAFAECSNLTKITIPAKVSKIPESAFAYCEKLAEVTLYNSVHRIEDSAFFGCPISKVIFYGTSEEWQRVWIDAHNDNLVGVDNFFTVQPTTAAPTAKADAPAGTPCKYCGEVHGNSFGQKVTAFFHKILAFFGLKKKA